MLKDLRADTRRTLCRACLTAENAVFAATDRRLTNYFENIEDPDISEDVKTQFANIYGLQYPEIAEEYHLEDEVLTLGLYLCGGL